MISIQIPSDPLGQLSDSRVVEAFVDGEHQRHALLLVAGQLLQIGGIRWRYYGKRQLTGIRKGGEEGAEGQKNEEGKHFQGDRGG